MIRQYPIPTTLKGGEIYFGSQFQKFQSTVGKLKCRNSMVEGTHIMAAKKQRERDREIGRERQRETDTEREADKGDIPLSSRSSPHLFWPGPTSYWHIQLQLNSGLMQ